MAVHASAIVEDGAVLGAGVEIGPFCIVGAHARLGDGVRLLSHAIVKGNTEVGARTVIHPNAVLGGEGQIRKNDFDGRLVVGSDCVIREGVTMSCGSRNGGGLTTVGNNGYFMAMSHIGHDCHVADDVTMANGAVLGGHSEIGQGVIFGGLSAVQQFCRVGRGAMIGGITGVNRDVIPYAMAFGDHVELAGLNLIGLKRRGLSRDAINAMRATFRLIFLESGGDIADRAAKAKEKWPGVSQVAEIADFLLVKHKQPLALARRRGGSADED
ncbi:MAG TPA: acyl-ACP--UDP-N-acetylglucosamine O-acyltransferase [Rhizomicrobium sp.]|jgi:UDP-N-acetylglucosamine acyltransferase|nr:acyl-ACP--UDP-N-acetylglucosamine O-acyltransferase [Rhizomicrobium sp.]